MVIVSKGERSKDVKIRQGKQREVESDDINVAVDMVVTLLTISRDSSMQERTRNWTGKAVSRNPRTTTTTTATVFL